MRDAAGRPVVVAVEGAAEGVVVLASAGNRRVSGIAMAARTAGGTGSLIYGAGELVRFALTARATLGQPAVPVRGDLAWLLTIGMPWRVWLGVNCLSSAAWAVGMVAAGLALVLTSRRMLLLAAAALMPKVILMLLSVPARIAILAHWVQFGVPYAPGDLLMQGQALGLALAVLWAVYVAWLFHEAHRLAPGSPPKPGDSPSAAAQQ